MNRMICALLVAAFTVVAIIAGASGALAATATISPGGAIATSSLGKLTFAAAGTNYLSAVALSGTITSGTYSAGGTFGTISRCSASGTLPVGVTIDCSLLTASTLSVDTISSTSVLFALNNFMFLIHIPNVGDCLYLGVAEASIGTGMSQLISNVPRTFGLFRTISGICSQSVTFAGTFSALAPAQTVTVP